MHEEQCLYFLAMLAVLGHSGTFAQPVGPEMRAHANGDQPRASLASDEEGDFTILLGFRGFPYAGFPDGKLIEGSDGLLYGTAGGGGYGGSLVFKIGKDGSGFVHLHEFKRYDKEDGYYPRTGLVEGSDGLLYGTTEWGGAGDDGTVFRIDKDGNGFETLHSFSGEDGRFPRGRLLEGSDGVLYGTTLWGGIHDNLNGTIFRINKDGSGFEKLHDFNRDDGWEPLAGLTEGSDGALYGTTARGGVYPMGDGNVFKINKDGSAFETIHEFDGGDGDSPEGELLEGLGGVLYGTTSYGGVWGRYGRLQAQEGRQRLRGHSPLQGRRRRRLPL